MKYLSGFDIQKIKKLPVSTIYSRFRSKDAEIKWGVEKRYFKDGSYHYVVSEKNFKKLWNRRRIVKRGRSIGK